MTTKIARPHRALAHAWHALRQFARTVVSLGHPGVSTPADERRAIRVAADGTVGVSGS